MNGALHSGISRRPHGMEVGDGVEEDDITDAEDIRRIDSNLEIFV